jgi:hypothetical protein
VDQRASGLRELHLARRFGSRGPGAAELPQYGPFKAEVADVLQVARRAFVDGNVALLVLGEEPPDLSFELRPGSRRAVPRPNGDLELPARMKGGSGGVSASMELPDSLPGRLAFRLLMSRLETRGTSGDLAAGVEQVGDRDVIATIHAPVTDAFIETAGAAIVQETAAIAQTPPPSDELRNVSAAWLADASATPYAFGWFVVSQMLLGVRLESRADLVDRLWEIEPEDVSLSAGLMTKTMLLLLPDGAEIADELIPERGLPGSPERIQGTRYRPVGAGIGWAAHARGELFVGDEGVSQVTRSGAVHTVRFDDLELVIEYDDGVVGLVGSRSWLQVDPRLWRSGDDARTTILDHVPGDRVVPLPKGEQARLADELTIEHERQAARRNLGKAVAIAAGTLAFIGLLALWASGRDEPKPLANCATVANGRATPVDCSSAGAQSRLLATMLFDGSAVGSCPLVADDIVPMVDSVTDYACLQRLRPPHPGDPGRGGGVLRAGDCVADPAAGPPGQEAPCRSARNWATVSATAANPAHCPSPAVDYLTRPSDSLKPIVCLTRGPGVLTPGDCVTDQSVTQLLEVGCGSPAAAFRVVARVAARGRCRSHDESALVAQALPRAAVACLRRL